MKPIDILRIAASTFVNNKMRTLLTTFGIAIGIGAIVFLVSFGYGLQKITIGEIQSIKALKTYIVTSGDSGILSMKEDSVERFRKISGVDSVNPDLSMPGQISFNGTKTDVLINAASAQFVDLESPKFDTGTQYTADDEASIIITSAAAKAFSIKSDEFIGKKVLVTAYIPNPKDEKMPFVHEKEYEVKGVIKDNIASYIYLPINNLIIPEGSNYSAIKVGVADSKMMSQVKAEITGTGYKASSIGEKVDQMNRIFRIVQIVLLVFGAIALIVASIGMFNTLTISLLERTRDIGVMKALGATDREIYLVFLAESAIIASVGGGMGIGGAIVLGSALNVLINTFAMRAGGNSLKPFQFPTDFILIILAFSILVGLITGLYPARRAAKLNPLDALRYE